MNRVKLNHEVGSIYTPPNNWDGEDFDHNFMSELVGTVVSVLGLFFLCFSLVVVL